MLLPWLVALLVIGTKGIVPDDYILRVYPHCVSLEGDPSITMKTDLRARVRVMCSNGDFEFNTTNSVDFHLQVSFKGRNSGFCEFYKRNGSQTYFVVIRVSYGEKGRMVSQDDEEFTVSCTYDPKKTSESGIMNIDKSPVAPKEIQYNEGPESNSTITMELTDVNGANVTGQSIDLGQTVRIRSTSDGASNEAGIRAMSCNAVGATSGKKYSILRDGCGEGVLFTRTEGFTTSGLVSWSPFFGLIFVDDDQLFSFECNFTLCYSNCDGDLWPLIENTRRAIFFDSEINSFRIFHRTVVKLIIC